MLGLTGVLLSEDQRTRLRDIANKGPVHRTIMSAIHVETRLAPQWIAALRRLAMSMLLQERT
jgi:hypothetical protein